MGSRGVAGVAVRRAGRGIRDAGRTQGIRRVCERVVAPGSAETVAVVADGNAVADYRTLGPGSLDSLLASGNRLDEHGETARTKNGPTGTSARDCEAPTTVGSMTRHAASAFRRM